MDQPLPVLGKAIAPHADILAIVSLFGNCHTDRNVLPLVAEAQPIIDIVVAPQAPEQWLLGWQRLIGKHIRQAPPIEPSEDRGTV